MTHEALIDSFIDGERVDQTALDMALASAEGRAYLIDALALREVMRAEPAVATTPRTRRPRVLRFAVAAAAAIAFASAGYAAGVRNAPAADTVTTTTASADDTAPPEPTRVIELKPGVNWHETTKGGD